MTSFFIVAGLYTIARSTVPKVFSWLIYGTPINTVYRINPISSNVTRNPFDDLFSFPITGTRYEQRCFHCTVPFGGSLTKFLKEFSDCSEECSHRILFTFLTIHASTHAFP